ncbi:MAG: YkgJ family cysteine cluster protein [Methanosarcinales archaeon]
MYEKYLDNILNLDDTFRFECRQCGKCCRNIEIMLTPYDILRLRTHFKTTTSDILKKYCKFHVGPNSKFPIATLKFRRRRSYEVCRFQKNGKCRVYPNRPGACRNYPLGRRIDEDGVKYIKVDAPPFCKAEDTDKEWRVKDWLIYSELALYHEYNEPFIEITMYLTKHQLMDYYPKNLLPQLASMVYDIDAIDFENIAQKSRTPVANTDLKKLKVSAVIVLEILRSIRESVEGGPLVSE